MEKPDDAQRYRYLIAAWGAHLRAIFEVDRDTDLDEVIDTKMAIFKEVYGDEPWKPMKPQSKRS